jgi:hypothetical protein
VILLLSTYDLGRQPFGLASPAAWLRRAGVDVVTRDLSREPFADDDLTGVTRVAFYLPMHTATRLALPVIDRIRAARPDIELCAYGLYAPLNAELLRERGVTTVLGPEAEQDLLDWAPSGVLGRLQFIQPDRSTLPPLHQYATLQMPDGTCRTAGATEATSIAAGTVPSSPSTTANSESSRRTWFLRISNSKSPLEPNTSRSAIRISSTGRPMRARLSRPCTRVIRRSPTT